jgi:hypothetical protein
VRPPDAPDWVISAVGFLLDQCPADYRAYEVLRRYPVILARFAAEHVDSAMRAGREGLATARSDLRDLVPPEAVAAAVVAYEREGSRLLRAAREVALVTAALRGERYVPRL